MPNLGCIAMLLLACAFGALVNWEKFCETVSMYNDLAKLMCAVLIPFILLNTRGLLCTVAFGKKDDNEKEKKAP